MRISEVDANNFNNDITILHEWISESLGDAPVLVPYWAAPANNTNLYLTAIKVF